MKPEIHPEYIETTVTCGCGKVFTTHSTKASGSIYVEVCSECHPFYTGKQRILDTGGRVAAFEKRFGKSTEAKQLFLKDRERCPMGARGLFYFTKVLSSERRIR